MYGRGGLWAGVVMLAVGSGSGCSANCEDDGLVQDDPSNCAAAGGQDDGSTSAGPPIPIDSEGTSSGTAGSGTSGTTGAGTSGSDTEEGTDPGTEDSSSSGDATTGTSEASTGTSSETGTPPSCRDAEHNGDETDVDCGGPTCGPCDDGQDCADPSDCTSGVCTDDTCVAPTCDDAVQNADETDVDCGGDTCGPCDDGEGCSAPPDCVSGVCVGEACAAATCKDGVRNGDETDVDCGGDTCGPCDDGEACQQNDDCASDHCIGDVCVPTPASCLEILLSEPGVADGVYEIDPDGPGGLDPFDVECDMTTDGGGWTGITPCIAQALGGTMIAVEPANIDGIDGLCRPFTRDAGPQVHTYHYTFTFTPTFTEFYLADYQAQANCTGNGNTADIGPFVQTDWNVCHEGTHGDIAFGSADAAGPVTSFAAEGTDVDTTNALVPWPAGNASYGVGGATTGFRIGWGEEGSQSEGWIPWAEGSVFLR